MIDLLKLLADRTHAITSDNDRKFARHERIAESLETNVYFAHPYASWERGSNENMNGLVRQYFPKKREFSTITDKEIEMAMVMDRLNNRSRKRLDFRTPNRVFFNHPFIALGIESKLII